MRGLGHKNHANPTQHVQRHDTTRFASTRLFARNHGGSQAGVCGGCLVLGRSTALGDVSMRHVLETARERRELFGLSRVPRGLHHREQLHDDFGVRPACRARVLDAAICVLEMRAFGAPRACGRFKPPWPCATAAGRPSSRSKPRWGSVECGRNWWDLRGGTHNRAANDKTETFRRSLRRNKKIEKCASTSAQGLYQAFFGRRSG